MAQDRLLTGKRTAPFYITADKIEYDTAENLYFASGNVTIIHNSNTLSADKVRYHPKTMKASASGNVVLRSGEDILTGSQMDLDMGNETGSIDQASLFLQPNHFYITGDSIKKIDKAEYTAERATVSTCDGESPAWKITGKHLAVTLEGYGSANHALFWIKNIPVFYTPYVIFPVKKKRQSGLLMPLIDYSDRLGLSIEQPFFWAISDYSDATFFVHHLSQRGTKTGLEYRYVLDHLSRGTLMMDFLTDRRIDDGRLDSGQDWGYEDDAILRPNEDRYWFRMKNDHAFENGFLAKLDLDIVSDQDYLHEFKDGYTGYKETTDSFNGTFGRNLDLIDDPIRTNYLHFNKNWVGYTLNSEVLWYDNVIERRQESINTTLQQLPFIEFSMLKKSIFNSPFYQDLITGYTHFYREEGTRGHRLDSHTRFYLPYRVKNILSFEPSLGLGQTTWHVDHYEDENSNKDRTQFRWIYDLRLDLSTELYKVFNSLPKPIKHRIRPHILYEYTPNLSQDQYPSFDPLDRIPETNLLTYSINTQLISRSEKKEIERQNLNDTLSNMSYHQFFQLELKQQYDINKANHDDPEPFSPIYTRLSFTTSEYLALDIESQWSMYQDEFVSRNAAMNILDHRGDRLFIEYRYANEDVQINPVESVNVATDVNLFKGFSVYGSYEHNIFTHEKIKQEFGVLYQSQCWRMDVRYWEENNNYKIKLSFKLKGLGDTGS